MGVLFAMTYIMGAMFIVILGGFALSFFLKDDDATIQTIQAETQKPQLRKNAIYTTSVHDFFKN